MSDLIVRPSVYEAMCVPEDMEDAYLWTYKARRRQGGLWSVHPLERDLCWGRDGQWVPDRVPWQDSEEWLAAHRYEYPEAIQLITYHAKYTPFHSRWGKMTAPDAVVFDAYRNEMRQKKQQCHIHPDDDDYAVFPGSSRPDNCEVARGRSETGES
jgi:hypothetical protein